MRLDDGRALKEYIPTPKPLAKKIRDTKFSEKERNLVDVIVEQTLGYEAYKDKDNGESVRRTTKPMSSNYLALLTGYSRSTVNRYIAKLDKRNILTVEYEWFNKQRTKLIGINHDLWQWDINNRVSKREYKELHNQAKRFVKEKWESINPSYKLVEGGRRDKTDFKLMISGVHKRNISVIVKVTWGEKFNIDKLRVPDKPNTIFCFMNKPMTRMVVIEPEVIQDLVPTSKVPPPVQDSSYIEVPNNKTSSGRKRMVLLNLAPPLPPVPNEGEGQHPH